MSIEAMKQALTQGEPVKDRLDFWALFDENQRLRAELKFNSAPQPQREWVGLTDEEIFSLCKAEWVFESILPWARIIEAELKEKNT